MPVAAGDVIIPLFRSGVSGVRWATLRRTPATPECLCYQGLSPRDLDSPAPNYLLLCLRQDFLSLPKSCRESISKSTRVEP